MIDWWLSLSGFTWITVTVLMGGATIGCIGAIVILMAKSITSSFGPHDREHCTCRDCEHYRVRQINNQPRSSQRSGFGRPGDWLSTAQLQEGMVVVAAKNGHTYLLKTIAMRSYGYTLTFINVSTRKQTWLTVPFSNAHHRIWRLTEQGFRRVVGL